MQELLDCDCSIIGYDRISFDQFATDTIFDLVVDKDSSIDDCLFDLSSAFHDSQKFE